MALKVGELYQTLEVDDSGYQQSMAEAEQTGIGLADVLKVGVAGAAAGVGAALAGAAAQGARNIKQLDDATNDFAVATGATEEEMESFRDTVQDLHKVNTDSYEELGEAVTAMRQRHGEASEGMEQDFLDYAKVTGQDTAQAVESLHGVQEAWRLETEDSTEVMDKFKAISQETGIDVQDLEQTMGELAPVAEAVGMDFDETAALLGHFEARGVDASTATRGLRNAMTRLEDPTESQAESLEKLGVEVRETEEGFEVAEGGMEDLMERLNEGELSSEEMSAAMDILGRRAGVDMVRAMEDGEAGVEEMMAVIEDSEGTVESASDQYDKSLGERWTLIQRKYLHPFMETIGEVLIGVLEDLLGFAEEWGPKVAGVFETISAVVGRIFGSDGEAAEQTNEFREALSGIFGAVRDIVGGLIDRFQDFWDLFGEDIVDNVLYTLEQLKVVASTVFGVIEGALDTLAGIITGDFSRAIEGLEQIWSSVWGGMRDLLENAWEHLFRDPMNKLWDRVVGVFDPRRMVEAVSETMMALVDRLLKDMPQRLADGAREMMDSFIGGLADAVEDIRLIGGTLADSLRGFISGESPPREGALSDIDKGGERLMAAYAGGLRAGAERYVLPAARNLADEMRSSYGEMEEDTKEHHERQEEEKKEYYSWLEERTEGVGQTLESAFSTAFHQILSGTKSFGDAMRSMFSNLIDNLISQIANFLAQQAVQGFLSIATGGLGGIGGGILGSILGGIFHDGGIVGRSGPIGDERLVMAQVGEGIISRDTMRRGMQTNGGPGKADITIELDGRVLAKAVEQPLADRIRVKGGVIM